jgi:hypothetical protein
VPEPRLYAGFVVDTQARQPSDHMSFFHIFQANHTLPFVLDQRLIVVLNPWSREAHDQMTVDVVMWDHHFANRTLDISHSPHARRQRMGRKHDTTHGDREVQKDTAVVSRGRSTGRRSTAQRRTETASFGREGIPRDFDGFFGATSVESFGMRMILAERTRSGRVASEQAEAHEVRQL